MRQVLQINTSIFDGPSSAGVSTQLANELMEKLVAQDDDLVVDRLDFSENPVPHLDGERLQALMTEESERTARQCELISYSDDLIARLQRADEVIIGVPMYNFSIPSMLKAWIDHVARAGVTFKYTENGAVGLLGDKKVYLMVTTGGKHEEGKTDHIRPLMKTILPFLGLDNYDIVIADGLNMGDEPRQEGIARAKEQIEDIAAARAKSIRAA
ncbi:MAG: NAD(P)H-dependent oxidoreductase [Pseudohongiellaceae bacterium]|nr:NAD(P)H-dependent oxidoreductase [Pseudohongiellaceae bacterium]